MDVTIVWQGSTELEDADDLARAAERCVELARQHPDQALALALSLSGTLHSFESDLRELTATAARGGSLPDDEELAASILCARLSLEETLAELPDNRALASR